MLFYIISVNPYNYLFLLIPNFSNKYSFKCFIVDIDSYGTSIDESSNRYILIIDFVIYIIFFISFIEGT